MIVFQLVHYKITQDEDVGDYWAEDKDTGEKPIGTFSTSEKAEEAVRHLVQQPGFRDWPGGFRIWPTTLDEYAWSSGFIHMDDA